MKKNIFTIFLLSLLFSLVSCGYKNTTTIFLEDNWMYSESGKTGFYSIIDNSQLPEISRLYPNRNGDIWLKTQFYIPDDLENKDLGLFLGNVKIASELFLNNTPIGKVGFFEPQPFTIGEKCTTYDLPSTLLNYGSENELIIHIYVNGEGSLGAHPYISTVEKINYEKVSFDFFNSKVQFIFFVVLIIIGFIYIFIYFLKPTDKEDLPFGLMNIFSALYIFSYCIGEFPFVFLNVISYLLFKKLFTGISVIITTYFAVSFIRDFLGQTDSLSRKIYRISLLIFPSVFLMFAQTMHEFYIYLGISYILVGIHLLYAVRLIIISLKRKNKKVIVLLGGFSPVLVSFVLTAILHALKITYNLYIITIAWQIVIFVFLLILIKNFIFVGKQFEYLNTNLERLVQNRTEELSKLNTTLEETNSHLKFEKERNEKEIELASFVQQSFYNIHVPALKNYEIAYYNKAMAGVSGDFYDFYYNNTSLEGFGIFDVSGHGISSGLVTMLVKNIINNEFYKGKKLPLNEVMNIINDKVIYEKGNIENYLTGILARINKDQIEFVNAGHPNALHYIAETQTCELIPRGDGEECGVIGISEFPVNFETITVNMNKGDSILLYTDGIVETMNRNREEFGLERLMRAYKRNMDLPINELIELIVDDARTFANRTKMTDDITIVLIKRKQ